MTKEMPVPPDGFEWAAEISGAGLRVRLIDTEGPIYGSVIEEFEPMAFRRGSEYAPWVVALAERILIRYAAAEHLYTELGIHVDVT